PGPSSPPPPLESRCARRPDRTQVRISMFAWRCGAKPPPPATMSSLSTRNGPKPMCAGSWYAPNEKPWRLSSHPVRVRPRSPAARSAIIAPRPAGPPANAASLGRFLFLLLRNERLGGDAQRNLVADVRDVGAHAEVAAFDARGRIEADLPRAHHFADLVEGRVEHDRARHAMQGQVAGHVEPVVARAFLDLRALERDGRVLLRVEEIRLAQMRVEVVDIGVQARQRDRDIDLRRSRVLLVEHDRAADVLEIAG